MKAISQIYRRINLNDPVLSVLPHLDQRSIIRRVASISAIPTLAGNLPAIVCSLDVTALRLDRKWRSLLVDNNIISDKHEGVRFEDFCQSLTKVDRYRSLARFVLEISSFPQSTAAVERTFSKLNLNKTKIRSRLSVNT